MVEELEKEKNKDILSGISSNITQMLQKKNAKGETIIQVLYYISPTHVHSARDQTNPLRKEVERVAQDSYWQLLLLAIGLLDKEPDLIEIVALELAYYVDYKDLQQVRSLTPETLARLEHRVSFEQDPARVKDQRAKRRAAQFKEEEEAKRKHKKKSTRRRYQRSDPVVKDV